MISEAEIRSMETAVAELAKRISGAADDLRDSPAETVAGDLYEAERYLLTARRRLTTAGDNLAAGKTE